MKALKMTVVAVAVAAAVGGAYSFGQLQTVASPHVVP